MKMMRTWTMRTWMTDNLKIVQKIARGAQEVKWTIRKDQTKMTRGAQEVE